MPENNIPNNTEPESEHSLNQTEEKPKNTGGSGFDLDVLDLSALKTKVAPTPEPDPEIPQEPEPETVSNKFKEITPVEPKKNTVLWVSVGLITLIVISAATWFFTQKSVATQIGLSPQQAVAAVEQKSNDINHSVDKLEKKGKFLGKISSVIQALELVDATQSTMIEIDGLINEFKIYCDEASLAGNQSAPACLAVLKIYNSDRFNKYKTATNSFLEVFDGFLLFCKENHEGLTKQEPALTQQYDQLKFNYKIRLREYRAARSLRIDIPSEEYARYPLMVELFPNNKPTLF
ncbi:hypothetical protein QUF70_02915 [Desulfobacterales bacterium HSG17]|nr:hypothetical protein [Desulfobacterales bacterium HSG17]